MNRISAFLLCLAACAEGFGLTDATLATADRIAAMDYITPAPDGGGTSGVASSRLAGDFMTLLPGATINAILNAWSDYAAAVPGMR